MSRENITKLIGALTEPPNGQDIERRDANLDDLVPLVYDELRRMAHAQLAREVNNATLDTTSLVHEAYLKLIDHDQIGASDRGHGVMNRGRSYFFGAAARAMRQVLVSAARHRNRHKRGSGERPKTLEDGVLSVQGLAAEVLDLDRALQRLEKEHPRAARVVECRFFGGLDVDQTAAILDVAPRTIDRDWVLARAWLIRELGASDETS